MKILKSIFLFLFSTIAIYANSIKEQSIVVVVPSYNNKNWYSLNVKSILNQEYDNFRLIYIDDDSNDGTAELVEEFANNHPRGTKLKLIKNSSRKGALENLWRAIHTCAFDDIIVTVDGDDWLYDNKVLQKINEVYSTKKVWLTYGQFQMYPSQTHGWCSKIPQSIIENHLFRKYQDVPSHLRTFKAGLFQKIALKDLVSFHGFYPMSWDVAMMIPMIEMACERHQFIEDILYVYNDATPLNDHKVNKQLQIYLSTVLRSQKAYKRIDDLIDEKLNTIDLIIVSQNAPSELLLTLKTCKKLKGLNDIHVIYSVQDTLFDKNYEKIKEEFSFIKFYKVNNIIPYHFKYLLNTVIKESKSDYILLSKDGVIVTNTVDLSICLNACNKTQAYCFTLRMGKNITKCYPYPWQQELPRFYEINNDILAWQLKYGYGDWAYPNNFEMTLYNKRNLLEKFKLLHFNNLESLEVCWSNVTDLDEVSLCFAESKSAKIIFNDIDKHYILQNFNGYFDFDISYLNEKVNSTARMEFQSKIWG